MQSTDLLWWLEVIDARCHLLLSHPENRAMLAELLDELATRSSLLAGNADARLQPLVHGAHDRMSSVSTVLADPASDSEARAVVLRSLRHSLQLLRDAMEGHGPSLH